ncbi:DUF6428 family protein [Desertivirga arenae]|uniref:DUF6428 family protein n=1 Tax=Desertivirga arenae TaxID=2810309 RepID=UPI001A967CD1|nr:DUF6428 family protein [Pedobacter sp. SYSU D00823]
MNNPNAMSWSAFKAELTGNQDLDLQFQYAEGEWVKPSYHITEIKQAPITSVDCGGKVNTWTEIIVQLWEPEEKHQEKPMKASKALSIVELVEKAIELNPSAEVKVEFGNSKFDTRQMFPSEVIVQGENLIVNLKADTVQCKALGRNQTCGAPDTEEACCSSTTEKKPKITLKNLATADCCTPGSGCC